MGEYAEYKYVNYKVILIGVRYMEKPSIMDEKISTEIPAEMEGRGDGGDVPL